MNPTKPTPTDPEGSSDVQLGEDYEKRFKGLQREHNKLVETSRALQEALDAATTEAKSLKSGQSEALAAAQTQASELRNQLTEAERARQQFEQENGTLKSQLTSFERKSAIRNKLVTSKANDLLPAFESGILNIADESDEAVTAGVEAFREFLKSYTGQQNQQQYGGASVPNVQPIGSGPGTSFDALNTWLLDHASEAGTPEYRQNQALYDQLLSKQ